MLVRTKTRREKRRTRRGQMNRDRRDCHHVAASDATGRTAAPTSVTSNDFDPQQKAKPAAHAA
jgi:hypothetical protein